MPSTVGNLLNGYDYSIVMEQSTELQEACPYKFLLTVRTATMEKEINEAASQGYAVISMSDTGAHTAILEKRSEVGATTVSASPNKPAQRYSLLGITSSSKLQEKLTDSVSAGFRVKLGYAISSQGMFQNLEGLLLLEKAEVGSAISEYTVVADGRPPILQEKLNDAASRGFRLLPQTMMVKSSHGGASSEIVAIMEKSSAASGMYQYLVLEGAKPDGLSQKLSDTVIEGAEFKGTGYVERALGSSESYFAIFEKRAESKGAPVP